MEKYKNIKDIVAAKNWRFLVSNSLPVNIADIYSFPQIMHMIDLIIEDSVNYSIEEGFVSDLMRDYCVNLMKIIRAKYPKEWNKDWKNEAFLGIICALVFREEEAFHHIQKAYEKLDDPPQSLILAYINAGSGPDHFLTKKQIEDLTNQALKKGVTYEAALHMASLAYEDQDFERQSDWEAKAEEAKAKGLHTPSINPDVLKEGLNEG